MTFEKVAKILADYKGCNTADIKMETTFAELEFDSLDTVELIMNFEEEFGITIEMSTEIKTVEDIVLIIEKALS